MKLKTLLTIGALAITGSLLNAQTTNPAPYCAADPANFTGCSILNVSMNTLNNLSAGLFGNSHYAYFSNLNTLTLTTNNTHTMSVSVQRADLLKDRLVTYIDFNGDNLFQANELVGQVTPTTVAAAPPGPVAFNYSITIPTTTFTGITRMRVIYTGFGPPVPCFATPTMPGAMGTGGEVEDYDVNLVTGAAIPPVANFTVPVSVCKNQTITLNDNSTNTPTAWSWSLTGASPATSTLQNPAVTYTNTGTYTISLVSSNASGASAIVSKTISIIEFSPKANFTVPVSVCKNQTITLNDNSTNTPTAWSWSLTGATPATSTLQNPAVTYTNAGTYTISLISTNASGASAIVSKTIAIGECTGIETNNLQTENLVSVYPNPSTGYYVVNLTNAAEVTIFNILGEKVIAKLLPSGKSTIDLSNQPNGVYSLIIGNTAKRQNVKIIKE